MAYTNPTALIAQLKTQLLASASWTGAGGVDANIHYPNAGSDVSFPCAILAEENITYNKILFGAQAIPTGSLSIFIADITSVGEVEELCREIAVEITTDIGIANLNVDSISPSNTPSAADIADGSYIAYECEISLSFGLTL